jgi:hypothetical protein
MNDTKGGGNKSLARLLAAIEGFYTTHGQWPVRVRLFPGLISSIKHDILSEEQYRTLSTKIELVPDADAPVIAEDNAGNSYNYGKEGFVKTKPKVRAKEWLGI